MNSLIMDECIQNLYYAQETMKEWIPMTEYEILFEATENAETAAKVAKNEATAAKSKNFVKKAIDSVIAIIKKLYNAIKEFIDRCTLKGDEREAFNEFRKAMANDPSLKNKKVTVSDFRKIQAEYDNIINELDQSLRAVKANDKTSIDKVVEKVTNFLKDGAKVVSTTVAADVALKMADSNVEIARGLSSVLKNEESIMETLSEGLGAKKAENFQKEIDGAAKNTLLHKFKVKVFRKQYDDLMGCVQGTIKTFTHAGFRDAKAVKEEMKTAKDNYKAGTIDKNEYKNQKKTLKNELSDAKKYSRDAINKDVDMLTNEKIAPVTKSVAAAAVSGGKAALKEQATRKINLKKKSRPEEKSALSFVFGRK